MAVRNSIRRAPCYPSGRCAGIAVSFLILCAAATSAFARAPAAAPPTFRESFDSGLIDWLHGWETDLGGDHYESFYRIDRLSQGFYFHDRRSYYAAAAHDYFNEEIAQIVRPYSERGFWDPAHRNWVSKLVWSKSDGWYAAVPHEWANCGELEECALMAALVSGNAGMDVCLAQELRFIHGVVGLDGQVASLVLPQSGFEYGSILSSLALGSLYFRAADPTLAETAYGDMRKVFRYVATNYAVPINPVEMTCVVIRGYANACGAFDARGDAQLRDSARGFLDALASKLVRYQNPDGAFRMLDDEYRVQRQLKAEIALLLAYGVTQDASYLRAARLNMDWVIANRWDRSAKRMGGIMWCVSDTTNYFEVHQMWFLIASKYLEDYTGDSFARYRDEAVAFLTDDNFAGVDMYEDNARTYGAFFSYRAISRDGAIQEDAFHQWKGAYEIGASLWAMALNYGCWSDGYARLATQAPEDSSGSWEEAIFAQRDFGSGKMTIGWDVSFLDAASAGGYTGLFEDRRGDWLILLDTSTGLSYKNRRGQTRVLVDREMLSSGSRYTVNFELLGEFERRVTLLENGEPVYSADIPDGNPFRSCYFGVFQDNGGALSAKNIYVYDIQCTPTIEPPPVASRLYPIFPNPCNEGATVELDVRDRGEVRLDIYDMNGKRVARLADAVIDPGRYRFHWDGRNASGRPAASGVYICRLEAPGLKQSEKIVLAR
jgi:hypothetical protein